MQALEFGAFFSSFWPVLMPFHVDSQSILSEFRRSQAPNTSPGHGVAAPSLDIHLAQRVRDQHGPQKRHSGHLRTGKTSHLRSSAVGTKAFLLSFEAASGAQATGRQGTEGQGHKDLGLAQGRVDTGTGDVETGTWVTLDNSYTA